MNKKELIEQLRKIEAQEKQDLIDKHLPVFREKYVGKYFKTWNQYSDNEYWWMYFRVDRIDSDDLIFYSSENIQSRFKGISFQLDTNKTASIDMQCNSYTNIIGDEITEAEFKAAWNEVQKEIDKAMNGKQNEP